MWGRCAAGAPHGHSLQRGDSTDPWRAGERVARRHADAVSFLRDVHARRCRSPTPNGCLGETAFGCKPAVRDSPRRFTHASLHVHLEHGADRGIHPWIVTCFFRMVEEFILAPRSASGRKKGRGETHGGGVHLRRAFGV